MTPKHYQTEVSPWDLQAHMPSSGNAFVDGRRCDAIKYVFRNKESLLEDLKKAKHCLEAAIKKLEVKENSLNACLCGSCLFVFDKTPDKTHCPNCSAPLPV